MKFNVFDWSEVKYGERFEIGPGWVRLRASAPVPLYAQAEGVEALVGVGAAFEFETADPLTVWADAPKGVRLFVQGRGASSESSFEAEGEVFTNIDLMPLDGGVMSEVRHELRMFELKRAFDLRVVRDLDAYGVVTPETLATDPVEPAASLAAAPSEPAASLAAAPSEPTA